MIILLEAGRQVQGYGCNEDDAKTPVILNQILQRFIGNYAEMKKLLHKRFNWIYCYLPTKCEDEN